jgi:AmmeMemoRadiSam system protein B
MNLKKMAFAGSWYPADAKECEASIKNFLNEENKTISRCCAGAIVPHAGWYYSGSLACGAIACLAGTDGRPDSAIDTVFVFGAHMHPQSEPFILADGAVETPFGDIEVDTELVERICAGITLRQRPVSGFPDDNTLELQYPFIRYFFPEAKIVVIGIAPSFFAPIAGSMAVSEAERLSRNIRVIGSTDMTHYGPDFGFTPAGTGKNAVEWVKNENDRPAIDAMLAMDEENIISHGLNHKSMCCPGAAASVSAACKKLGAVKPVEFGYATSFEKTASTSFVGYAAVVYCID